jgi:hypothetical protein
MEQEQCRLQARLTSAFSMSLLMDVPKNTMLPLFTRKATQFLFLSLALLIVPLCIPAKLGPMKPSAMLVPTLLPTLIMPTWDGRLRDIVRVPSHPLLHPLSSPIADGSMAQDPSPSTTGPRRMLGVMFPGLVFTRVEGSTSAGDGLMVCGAELSTTSLRRNTTGPMPGRKPVTARIMQSRVCLLQCRQQRAQASLLHHLQVLRCLPQPALCNHHP